MADRPNTPTTGNPMTKIIAALALGALLTGCQDGERMVAALTGKPTPAQIAAEAVKPVLFVAAVEPVVTVAVVEVVEPEPVEACYPIFRVRACP